MTLCDVCPTGTFSLDVASGCTECAAGLYSANNGSSACHACEVGMYSTGSAVSACFECPAGSFSTGTHGCSACENGTYSPISGMSACTPCSTGKFFDSAGASECMGCLPGWFASGTGAVGCTGCEKGEFVAEEGASTCAACSAGTFSAELSTSACSNCSAGTYSTAGASGCQACPDGMYATKVGMTTMADCWLCEAGTFLVGIGTVCRACAPGKYSWEGAVECAACPDNSDSPGRARIHDCVCRAGYSSNWTEDGRALTCNECAPGKFSPKAGGALLGECQDCTLGEYSLGGPVIACSLCLPGTFLDQTGRSACSPCSAGTFSGYFGATQCRLCTIGTYAGQGLSVCLGCQAGTFGDRLGMGACEDCPAGRYGTGERESVCLLCPAGKFQESTGNTGCELCLAGTYSTMQGLANASQCTDCSSGYYSTAQGLTDAKGCQRCPVGKMSDAGGTTCGDCRPGEFPNEAYGACASCPLHSVPGVNASRPEECRCTGGYRLGYNAKGKGGVESYSDQGALIKVHTFESTESEFHLFTQATVEAFCAGEQVLPPTVLQEGDYPAGEGHACSPPRVVRYEVDALFDEQETQSYAQCVPCRAGTYSVGEVGESCQQCPAKTYQDTTGQTSCKTCLSGRIEKQGMTFCEPCPGTTVVQSGECRPCPAGTFFSRFYGEPVCMRCPNNMWSEQDWDDCKLCPANSVGPGGSALSGCRCNAGLEMQVFGKTPYCVACKPGKYSTQGGNTCLPCWNGTYNAQVGSGVCYACPSYGIAWGGATACTTCALGNVPSKDGGSCVPCPAGYYCGMGVLYACPAGSYSIKTGLTLKSQCPVCPRNYFCRSATTIEACPANTWSPLGSITRHYCVCNSGYKCSYSFSTVGNVNLALTQEQYEAQKDQIIQALAKAAGVDASMIKIVGVTQQSP